MNSDQPNEKLITRYLLGEVSDEEQSRVESRIFGDASFFLELEATRDELIDHYLHGDLANHERERFEVYFMESPSRRERVESARALMSVLSYAPAKQTADESAARQTQVPSRQGFFAFLSGQTSARYMTGAAIVLVVVAAWLFFENAAARKQLEQNKIEQTAIRQREQELQRQLAEQQSKRDELANQLRLAQSESERLSQEFRALRATEPGSRLAQVPMVSLTLSPVLIRDRGNANELVIAPGVKMVRLQMRFEGDRYKNYRAALQTVEGQLVSQRDGLEASGKTVVLQLPANAFKEADYLLTLSGVNSKRKGELVGKYYFRVSKK